jgi:hypothetical protein
LRDLTFGIIQITEHPNPCHACRHAGWLLALLNKFDTKPTFFDVALFFDNPHIVRTGSNAIFATDAFILIDQNDSIFSLMGSPGGTYFHTGRIITMLALDG